MAYVVGSDVAETVTGTDEDDFLNGLAGADILDGGLGIDVAVYLNDTQGITVDLGANQVTDGSGMVDTLISIEGVTGTAYADTIMGSDGDDHFVATGGGDTINGGMGEDWIYYDLAEGGVSIDIMNGMGSMMDPPIDPMSEDPAPTDSLIMIDNVRGSAFGDYIVGTMTDNILDGGDGDDSIYGWMGTDTLIGGDGDDILDPGSGVDYMIGGEGADRFDFSINHCDDGANTIEDFEVGVDTIYVYDTPTTFEDYVFRDDDDGTMIYLRGEPQLYLLGVYKAEFSISDAEFV